MDLIVLNVPAHSTSRALLKFIREGLVSRFRIPFQEKPRILKCVVMKYTDRDTGKVEYHGLVSIKPDKAAQNVVRRLNQQKFNGRRIEIRKFHHRSIRRDPRRLNMDIAAATADERRAKDRRRNLQTDKVEEGPKYEGLAEFNRTFD